MRKKICLLLAVLICFATTGSDVFAAGSAADAALVPAAPQAVSTGAAPSEAAEQADVYPGLAVTGENVWCIRQNELYCERPLTGETAARVPLSEFLAKGERAEYSALASWDDDSVLLILDAHNGATSRRTVILELVLKGDAVEVRQDLNVGNELDFLFAAEEEWNEIDMMTVEKQLFIAALDQSFEMHFFLYTPENTDVRPLGDCSLAVFFSAVPYGEDVLLAGPNEMDDTLLELTLLSLKDGSKRLLRSIPLDYSVWFFNFAYSEQENLLYMTSNNMAYTLRLDTEEAPEPFGAFPSLPAMFRLGVLVENLYTVNGEDGQLLTCSRNSVLAMKELRVLNPLRVPVIAEAAADFSLVYPEYMVSVLDGGTEEDILRLLREAPAEYDAFVLRMGSETYKSLLEESYMAELSDDADLSAIAEGMPAVLQTALKDDGRLIAFPLSVTNYCQILNSAALEKLSGISHDELPTDWPGFLELLSKLANKGAFLNDTSTAIYAEEISAEEFRETLFIWMLQDCFLWAEKDSGNIASLKTALIPALKAFNKIKWTRLGLPEYGSFNEMESEMMQGDMPASQDGYEPILLDLTQRNESAVLSDGMLEITTMSMAEGAEFWPLSIQDGGDRLISQTVEVFCVNPHSPNREETLCFLRHVWDKTDIFQKMSICQSMNEPVLNTTYEEDLRYMTEMVAGLEAAAANESRPMEKELINADLAQARALMEDYRKNAYWSASAESIAFYRGAAENMIPIREELWTDPALDEAIYLFLDGRLKPKQFAGQLEEYMRNNAA